MGTTGQASDCSPFAFLCFHLARSRSAHHWAFSTQLETLSKAQPFLLPGALVKEARGPRVHSPTCPQLLIHPRSTFPLLQLPPSLSKQACLLKAFSRLPFQEITSVQRSQGQGGTGRLPGWCFPWGGAVGQRSAAGWQPPPGEKAAAGGFLPPSPLSLISPPPPARPPCKKAFHPAL